MSFRNRFPSAALLFLGALLSVVPYFGVLTDGSQALLFRDLSNILVPYKATWLAGVAELGRIPQWDSLHSAGFPFVADMGYGPLYPLNWLLFPLGGAQSAARALTLLIVLHHALIYAGFFLFFRRAGVRPLLALAGGCAMAWVGPCVSSDNLFHELGAQVATGFFLFFWWRGAGARFLDLVAASAALAWPLYAGQPQYCVGLGVFAAWIALERCRGNPFLAVRRLAGLAFLTVLAAAPPLFSTGRVLLTLGRALDNLTDADRMEWSLRGIRLAETFFPLAFGTSPAAATGKVWDGQPAPFIFSLYTGATMLALGMLFLLLEASRRRRVKKRLPALVAFACVVLLALGHNAPIPLYAVALKLVPLWSNFRYPERLAYWISVPLVLYGIFAAEKLARLRRAAYPRAALVTSGIYGVASLSFLRWLWANEVPVVSLLRTAPVLFAFLALFIFPYLARYRAALLALLILLDLGSVAHSLVWPQPLRLTDANLYPWARKILDDREKEQAARKKGEANRFFSSVTALLPGEPLPGDGDLFPFVHSAWAGMKFNTPTYWGIPLVRSHATLSPNRPVLALSGESPALARRVLDLHSTRYLLGTEGGTPVATVNPSALPQVLLPGKAEFFSGVPALLSRLRDLSWDPLRSVLLETKEAENHGEIPVEVGNLHRHWDTITLTLRAAQATLPRWLLFNEAYDSGWRARLGEKELEIVRANGWAMGVELPALPAATDQTIEFEFTDRGFVAGKWVFALWLAAATAACIPYVRRSSRRGS
jgi:hypothetical protein